MAMRGLLYDGPKDISVKNLPIPNIEEAEVLIKISYCGVCGTDLHIYNGEGGAFAVNPPLIMGHEFSGTVVEIGSQVKTIKVGDLVSVDPNNMCGECYNCQNAMEQFCSNTIGIGTTVDGGFAEYIAVTEKQVFKFREGTDPLIASMAEPVSCCIHGIDLCQIKQGDEVLIIGGGPIGLMMLQLAKLTGASKVILSEPVEEKRLLGKKLGADIVLNPLEDNVKSILADETKNINVVIECVGKPTTLENAVEWAGKGSTIMMFGLTGPDAEMTIKPDVIFKKELKLTSSFINPYTFQRAIALLESGRINIKDIIGEIVDLENCANVFTDNSYRSKGKIIIKLNDHEIIQE